MPDRAVVAISDDRQCLVVLGPHAVFRDGDWRNCWSLLEWSGISFEDYGWEGDTGQDAHEVLREFLEGARMSVLFFCEVCGGSVHVNDVPADWNYDLDGTICSACIKEGWVRDGTTPDSDQSLRDVPTDREALDDEHPGAGAGSSQ